MAMVWRAGLIVVLLLAGQALGLAHRVAHGGGWTAVTAPISPASTVVQRGAAGLDVDVHGHEAGTPICQLIDQLAHADALSGRADAAPVAGSAGPSAAAQQPASAAARAPSPYLARAPPQV